MNTELARAFILSNLTGLNKQGVGGIKQEMGHTHTHSVSKFMNSPASDNDSCVGKNVMNFDHTRLHCKD